MQEDLSRQEAVDEEEEIEQPSQRVQTRLNDLKNLVENIQEDKERLPAEYSNKQDRLSEENEVLRDAWLQGEESAAKKRRKILREIEGSYAISEQLARYRFR